jgi:hypothetical protein
MLKRIIKILERKSQKTYIFDLINSWPQFIQYIIFNDLVSFDDIIQLSQTCKTMRDYFHRMLKTYHVLCKYMSVIHERIKIKNYNETHKKKK